MEPWGIPCVVNGSFDEATVPDTHILEPFIRGKIRRVLNKTRMFCIHGTFRLK